MNIKKIFFSITLFIFLSAFIPGDDDIFFKMNKSLDVFSRVFRQVNLDYVDYIDPEEFMTQGIKGMLSSLDPYTVFLDESLQRDVELITTGKYGGIGITVGIRNSVITVLDLIEGYSAQRQGMRIGDVIISVDTTEFSKLNYSKLSSYLKGEPGTIVKVKVLREEVKDTLQFDLVREEIEIKNITYYAFLPEQSNNVYLKLSSFTITAGEEIKDALSELKQIKPIKSIILDLRGNPGGLLDAAIDVSEKFLKNNQLIVKVIPRDTTKIQEYFSEEEPISGDSKLIVLINELSASASEIVAGAIQDHDRGVILGENSFGKGLVQTIFPLSFDTSVKITTAKYFTPSGRCIQKEDYTGNTKLFKTEKQLGNSEFTTDSGRKVFEGYGITPDTLVEISRDSKFLNELYVKGIFFKFATFFFNQNENLDLEKLNENNVITEFDNYLKSIDFEFEGTLSDYLSNINESSISEIYDNEVKEKIKELKNLLIFENKKIIERFSEQIFSEIMNELFSRKMGRKGRIINSLKNDYQFNTALALINNEDVYYELLK